MALYPKRMNFLVSAHFFDQKPLCYLLRFVQCVRKEQFATDVAAIRDMRSLVTAGGNILLYPEGEVNGTGRTGIFQESTARLCKLLRVPVYAVRTKGSYLTRPKWGPSRRRGRVETEVTRIATAEELAALSNEALDARIREGIFHDEYAWQAQARIPFHAKAPAEGQRLRPPVSVAQAEIRPECQLDQRIEKGGLRFGFVCLLAFHGMFTCPYNGEAA